MLRTLFADLAAQTRLPADETTHLLNRITWGARPQDVARARSIGLEAVLDEQLNPHTIDDSALESQLSPILTMDRRTLFRLSSEYRAYRALVRGTVMRAVHSERQLLERMVDFWTDHFNVPFEEENGPDLVLFQREAIRRHALGRFRDLLLATAKAPAMLVYLDNFVNVAQAPNANYARELMELHTLGVEGGYTEDDVVAVARAFTGWTVDDRVPDGFYFNREEHDEREKVVLGRRLPAGRGIEDGLHVLSILADHPSTARYISAKLIRRFVRDDPPADLVESTAAVWQATGGQIRPVLRHILTSEAFAGSVGQKYRRPFDFLVAALRATGTTFAYDEVLFETLQRLGQVPFGWKPPDGYPDTAAAWLNTGGLLMRWNTASLLTHTAYSATYEERMGVRADLHIEGPRTAGQLVDAVAQRVFAVPLPASMRAELVDFVTDGGDADTPVTPRMRARKLASLYQLMLASPMFQWR
ncbi:MAG: DUF1800 domain-containing protein [Chloroflexi bacterium]|nr:DUF1800 domain-containing protein [Chloroflexota bacterium]